MLADAPKLCPTSRVEERPPEIHKLVTSCRDMLGGFGFRAAAHDGLLSYILVEYVGTQKKSETQNP